MQVEKFRNAVLITLTTLALSACTLQPATEEGARVRLAGDALPDGGIAPTNPETGTDVALDPADPDNCGGVGRVCPAGARYCLGQTCTMCENAGMIECDGQCVNMLADPGNCGACGAACGEGEMCWLARCRPASSIPPCVDDEDCFGRRCVAGGCIAECGPGVDCPAGTQCLQENEGASGMCMSTCRAEDECSEGARCIDFLCEPESWCDLGACDCGGGEMARCGVMCSHLDSDPQNCGACGRECPIGRRSCEDGLCTSCQGSGVLECDGWCTDVNWDRYNCGECGRRCDTGRRCVMGVCD